MRQLNGICCLIIKREKEEKMHFIYYFVRKLLNCAMLARRKNKTDYFNIILKVINASFGDGCKNPKNNPNNCC